MNIYQKMIALSRYARWSEDLGRRESWIETVDRYISNVVEKKINDRKLISEIRSAIINMDIMPSMRMMMTAGPALDRDHMAGYNCSFVAMDHPRAFDEIMYILSCGTGVGFSVESQFIDRLPEVSEEMTQTDTTIIVPDSKVGWASSFRELISLLYSGKIPKIDLSRIRPKGTRLKVFGGRASGPDPFKNLVDYTIDIFMSASGRKLNSLEVHGIVCKIGEIVVSGGVRRSALISLGDLSDHRHRCAKSGRWWEMNPEFGMANNSAVYNEKPTVSSFLEEWKSLHDSKSGERGIYYRKGIRNKVARSKKRNADLIYGVNPCGEIALRNAGLCNLSEVIVRPSDSVQDLERKVTLAAILGTIQATYTNFRYVRSIWKKNAEEERLLGVSLTGIYDHPLLSNVNDQNLQNILINLRNLAVDTNLIWSKVLGINSAAAVTTIKPSGTVSQLVDSSPGLHPRHSRYYIRTVRQDIKDPLTQFLIDQGIPHEPCVSRPDTTIVFSFPMQSPELANVRDDIGAIDHLKLWKIYSEFWSEHQVSVTVTVRESEWIKVADWVYDNFEDLSGLSFLPYDLGSYKQAPYQSCSETEYLQKVSEMPSDLDLSSLSMYETEDMTVASQEIACVAGGCEL